MIRLPELLNSSLSPVRRIQPIKASVRLSLTPLSTADMELIPGDTIPERALVRMYTIQGMAGIFRASSPEQTYGSRSTRVRLEHAVCEIGDWTVKTEIKEQEKTVAQAIPALFANYGGTLWSLGEIACTETVILQASKGANVLEAILSVLAQVPGYMVTMDQTVTPWVLGVAQKPTTVSAEGRLSRNITSVTIRQDDSDLCNRVYIDGMSGHLDDLTSQARYGIIEHTMSETGLSSSIATRMAQAYLDAHKDPALSVKISMLDLSTVTGEPLDAITLGKLYRLAIPQDQLVIEQTVVGISFSDIYGQPNSISVSLANEVRDTVTYLRRQRRGGGVSARNTEREVEKLTVQYTQKFEVSDQKVASIMEATGVLLDANNNPVVDPETGLFVFDTSNQGATMMSRIDQTAAGVSSVVSQVGTVTAVFDKDHPGGYAIGDRVLHNGVAYRFTQAHAQGTDWTGTDVTAIPVMQTEITRVGQTADSVYSEVVAARDGQSNLKSRIDQEAGKISQVVTAVGKNGQVTAASIVTAINNQTGEGIVDINADRVKLTGGSSSVTLNDKIVIDSNGYTQIKGVLMVSGSDKHVSINNGKVTAGGGVDISSGQALTFVGTQSGEYYALTAANIKNHVTDIQVLAPQQGSNTYTLQKKTVGNTNWQDAGTFSRATSLSGGWSGGTYTVRATPQNEEKSTALYAIAANGEPSKSSTLAKYLNVPLKVLYDDGDATNDDKPATGFTETISVDASLIWDKGWDDASAVVVKPSSTSPGATVSVSWPYSRTSGGTTTRGTDTLVYTLRSTHNDAYLSIASGETWVDYAHITHNMYDSGKDAVVAGATLTKYTDDLPSGKTATALESGAKYKLEATKDGTAVSGSDVYYSVPAGSTVGSITVGGTDQGNPSSNVNPGTITINALASDGTTVLKTATYDKLYLTEGGWNTSTNKKAVNIRVGGDTSDDPLIARLWITGPSVSHNISVSGFGTYTGSVSAYTRIGSISAANVNSVRNSGYIVFTVKCGGTTEKFAVTVNA